ncbi:hypothetical protein I6F38_28130 [Bradyrhizobium sp. BRP56]|nr:hypothetical protein [Bradyrhizobium sp. BRP56]
MDGINAGRRTIPFARFDRVRTARGLDCLREYKAEWDQDNRVFKKTPDHNWASHGADAWRCLANAWRAPMREPEKKPEAPLVTPMQEMTIDEWVNDQPSDSFARETL